MSAHPRGVPGALGVRALSAYDAARNAAALGPPACSSARSAREPALLLCGAVPLAIGVAGLLVLAPSTTTIRRAAHVRLDA